MKKTFEIKYCDPKTGEPLTVTEDFEDTEDMGILSISAKEWAEDYGYTLADKGWFSVKEKP